MRPATLLTISALATLASCTTSDRKPSDPWHEQQRARLERTHSVRTLDEALAEVLAQAPRPSSASLAPELPAAEGSESKDPASRDSESEPPMLGAHELPREDEPLTNTDPAQDPPPDNQSPQHIDQRLPAAPSKDRAFRHTWQPLTVTLDYGVGNVMARADGSRLGDRTNSAFARARLDTGTGAALHAEWWGSDLELFAGKFISDGVTPRRADAELGGADVFPHIRFDNQASESWSIPVRVGLFGDWQQLDHQPARVEREWLSFGPRVLLEPTWTMFDGEHGNLQLFTRLGGDVGPAWFTEEYPTGDDRDVVPRWSGEIGGGLRGTYGAWHAELGYRLNHTTLGKTDGRLYGERGRTELQRQQVFLGFGFTY